MKLLIVGAGGHGRCCLDIAESMGIYEKISFLDDKNIGSIVNGSRIIGRIDEMSCYFSEYKNIFIAIGNNKLRKELMNKAETIGYTPVSLISKKSFVSLSATVGKGSVVFPFVSIEANACVAQGNIVSSGTVIHHDATVDEYCLIYAHTVIRPRTYIGEYTRIGSHCVIVADTIVPAESDISEGHVIDSSR